MKEINEETMLAVMEEFSFERVVIAMDALEWTYYDSTVITTAILKNAARTLWESARDWNKDQYTAIESGGFRWSKRYNGAPLVLEFIVEGIDWIGGDDD